MATEKDFALLDDYLSNRLSGGDRSAFEQMLASDPELKKEFDFQQQLIDQMKRERVLELKKMLNEIAVPASSWGSNLALKISATIITIGLVGLGLYFWASNDAEPASSHNQETIASQPATEQPEVVLPEKPENNEPVSAEEKISEPADANKKQPASSSATRKQTKRNTQQAVQPKLDLFDPTKELEATEENSSIIIDETSPVTIATSSIAVETDNSNKKLDFHYQFTDGKLLLYGTFEKNLYEILEFFSNNKQTIFLFYNSNYYLLDEKEEKPTPLKPITDQALLKKLKEYRGN